MLESCRTSCATTGGAAARAPDPHRGPAHPAAGSPTCCAAAGTPSPTATGRPCPGRPSEVPLPRAEPARCAPRRAGRGPGGVRTRNRPGTARSAAPCCRVGRLAARWRGHCAPRGGARAAVGGGSVRVDGARTGRRTPAVGSHRAQLARPHPAVPAGQRPRPAPARHGAPRGRADRPGPHGADVRLRHQRPTTHPPPRPRRHLPGLRPGQPAVARPGPRGALRAERHRRRRPPLRAGEPRRRGLGRARHAGDRAVPRGHDRPAGAPARGLRRGRSRPSRRSSRTSRSCRPRA